MVGINKKSDLQWIYFIDAIKTIFWAVLIVLIGLLFNSTSDLDLARKYMTASTIIAVIILFFSAVKFIFLVKVVKSERYETAE